MPSRFSRSDPTQPLAKTPLSGYVGSDGDYRTGTDDPLHGHDIGAGFWGSHKKTLEVIAKKEAILELIGTGATWVYTGRNATAHLAHYFGNTGSTYRIDLENMVQFVSSAKENMVGEFGWRSRFFRSCHPAATSSPRKVRGAATT